MKKAQKRFFGTALTLSTVASIVAPVAVSAATVTYADAKAKVDAAIQTPTFKTFNLAYEAVMNLSNQDDQAKLLNELAPLWNKVATKYVTDILAEMENLAKDKNLKTYNELLAKIEANTDKEEATNKEYLLGELTAWGQSGALYTAEEKAAIDAIVKAWTDKTPANVQAAKDAAAKVKNAGSLEWLNGEISKITAQMSISISSFKATSDKTFEVTFNKAIEDTSKMALTLKRDGAKANVEKTEWSKDKTTATITLGGKIVEADYQVFAKNGDEAEISSEVLSLEESKPVKIEIVSNKLTVREVEDRTTGKKRDDSATFRIKITNQYGQDITNDVDDSDLKIRASRGDDEVEIGDDGLITITGDTDDNDDEFNVGDSVIITVQHKEEGIVVTKTLTVVDAADVVSIELGDLTPNDKSNKDRITAGVNFEEYYIPLTVKDADGNVLSRDELIDAIDRMSSSDDDVFDVYDEDDMSKALKEVNKKPVIKLRDGDESGKVVITIVAKNGVTASKTYDVDAEAGIDKISFNSPDITVKKGEDFVLTFTAYDQFGEQLIDEDDFPRYELQGYDSRLGGYTTLVFFDDEGDEGTEIEVDNGTIDTQIDYANNNALQLVLTPDPNADDKDKLTVSVDTVTGKRSEVKFSIKDEAYAEDVTIASITTKVLYDTSLSIPSLDMKRSKLNLTDQYGDKIILKGYELWLDKNADGTNSTYKATLAKYVTYVNAEGQTVKALDPTASVIKYELKDGGKVFNLGASDNTKNDPKLTMKPVANGTEELEVSIYRVEEKTTTDINGNKVKYGVMSSRTTDQASVTLEAVKWSDLTGYTIDNFDKIYTGDVYDYVQDEVDKAEGGAYAHLDDLDEYQNDKETYGLVGSTKVKIPAGLIVSATTDKEGIGAYISSNKVVVGKTSGTSIDLDTDDLDKTATVTIVFKGANGKVYNVKKEFTYSSKDPVVSTFQLRDEYDQTESKSNFTFDQVEIDGKNIDTLHKTLKADKTGTQDGQKAAIRFYTKDQYGVEINGAKLTIANTKQVSRASGEAALYVDIDADGKLQIANAKKGDTFTISALTNNGQYKAITITLDKIDDALNAN